MAKVVTDNQYYTAIANAIRALTGSGNTYTPAQMAPAIIGYIAGGIDLSDIESYFITDVINAMNYVKELGTDDWVHHIVTTDNHFTKNYGHSTAIVKAMQDTGYFSKVINLGDIVDSANADEYASAVENYGQFNGNMLFAIGNHDAQGSLGWQTFFYENLLSDDTDIVVDSSSNYNYYWDDQTHHIRYIVYIYTDGATYAINRIKDAPAGYSIITLCHYKDKIESSILLPLLGRQINYIGNITGHYHIDSKESNYAGMYNEVSLNNDGWINDDPSYIKTDGTNESQAITIMSINTSTRNVKFYRIGMPTALGQSWQYTYIQGGTVDIWERGYYWSFGTLTPGANSYYCTKLCQALDANDNAITYRIYAKSGTLTYVYAIGLDANGDYVTNQRYSATISDLWARKAFVSKAHLNNSAVTAMLFSVSSSGDVVSPDDIVITTDPVPLDRLFADADWETGIYLNSSGGNVTNANSATSYAFDILPSTTYRFYVDEADWNTTYMYAFLYSDESSNLSGINTPKFTVRKGSSASVSEITFTTDANTRYCRISVSNLVNVVDDFETKCHLEVVTA